MREQTCCDKNMGEPFTCGQLRDEVQHLTALLAERDAQLKHESEVAGKRWDMYESERQNHNITKAQLTARQQECERLAMLLAEKNFDRTAEVFDDARRQTAREIVESLECAVQTCTPKQCAEWVRQRYGLDDSQCQP